MISGLFLVIFMLPMDYNHACWMKYDDQPECSEKLVRVKLREFAWNTVYLTPWAWFCVNLREFGFCYFWCFWEITPNNLWKSCASSGVSTTSCGQWSMWPTAESVVQGPRREAFGEILIDLSEDGPKTCYFSWIGICFTPNTCPEWQGC